ncbi:hypothetical protein D3C72_1919440 [compost metagenome]
MLLSARITSKRCGCQVSSRKHVSVSRVSKRTCGYSAATSVQTCRQSSPVSKILLQSARTTCLLRESVASNATRATRSTSLRV